MKEVTIEVTAVNDQTSPWEVWLHIDGHALVFRSHEPQTVQLPEPEPEPPKISGRDAVLKMRDDCLALVAAYNKMGLYAKAQDAQAMAIALHKFEEKHSITEMAWPVEVKEHPEYGWEIQSMGDDGLAIDDI